MQSIEKETFLIRYTNINGFLHIIRFRFSFICLSFKIHKILFNTDLRKRGSTPKGDILSSHRLNMALRWFAGGCKYDIAPYHGVSPYEVIKVSR